MSFLISRIPVQSVGGKVCSRMLLCLCLLFAAACDRGTIHDETRDSTSVYTSGEILSEEGTGRYYMGREIARVLGHQDSTRMERPSREEQEFPNRVVQALNLKPSDVVADIGAGTGYFTFRISAHVPHGKVFAVDIDSDMLDLIRRRMAETGVRNVEPVLGTETDPHLPADAVDVALVVDAYHEFSHPREMMEQLVAAVRPGGRVVLVEYRGEDPTLPVDPLHTMIQEQAIREMEAVGLKWRETLDVLPQQHYMVFIKPVD